MLAVCAKHDAELTILHYDWAHLVEIDELADVIARSNETLDLWEQALTLGLADGSLRSAASIATAVRIITRHPRRARPAPVQHPREPEGGARRGGAGRRAGPRSSSAASRASTRPAPV